MAENSQRTKVTMISELNQEATGVQIYINRTGPFNLRGKENVQMFIDQLTEAYKKAWPKV